MPFYLL
jgi:hypothetical protein